MTAQTIGVPAGELTEELMRLNRRERALSQRRNDLHEQIDRLYLAAPLDATEIARLDRLEALEREISTQRHRLHREIDQLRATIGLPPWRAARELDGAAQPHGAPS